MAVVLEDERDEVSQIHPRSRGDHDFLPGYSRRFFPVGSRATVPVALLSSLTMTCQPSTAMRRWERDMSLGALGALIIVGRAPPLTQSTRGAERCPLGR